MDNALYAELKPDIEKLSAPLFDLCQSLLRARDAFLPSGAVLTSAGEIELIAAAPHSSSDEVSSPEVLPNVHDALRARVRTGGIMATAVAEDVTITLGDGRSKRAIKVLIEHARGLNIALYLPHKKSLFRRYQFDAPLALAAAGEVLPWSTSIFQPS